MVSHDLVYGATVTTNPTSDHDPETPDEYWISTEATPEPASDALAVTASDPWTAAPSDGATRDTVGATESTEPTTVAALCAPTAVHVAISAVTRQSNVPAPGTSEQLSCVVPDATVVPHASTQTDPTSRRRSTQYVSEAAPGAVAALHVSVAVPLYTETAGAPGAISVPAEANAAPVPPPPQNAIVAAATATTTSRQQTTAPSEHRSLLIVRTPDQPQPILTDWPCTRW